MLLIDDSFIASYRFKAMDSLESFIGVQASLEFNMCEPGTGIHKDTATFAGIRIVSCVTGWRSDAVSFEFSSPGGANKVIDEDELSRHSFIG